VTQAPEIRPLANHIFALCHLLGFRFAPRIRDLSDPGMFSFEKRLLFQWRAGDNESLNQLVSIIYRQLHTLAHRYMRSERPGHTLRTTALVHEAFLRLVDAEISFRDRAHFLAVSARMMRRILVDHARSFSRAKRGAGAAQVTLDEEFAVSEERIEELLDLNDAMGKLAEFDPRKSELVEMVFFGGLTYEEIGEVLNMSVSAIHRELKLSKARLRQEMSQKHAAEFPDIN
jgi:RNA polymerase sigma factor (TIGR02999 family)